MEIGTSSLASLVVSATILSSTTVLAAVPSATQHVIGAGLGRTGTMSFKTALGKIGLDPIFHMEDSMDQQYLLPFWKDLARVAPVSVLPNNADEGGPPDQPVWPPKFSSELRPYRVEILRQILGVNQTYWTESERVKMQHQLYKSAVDFPTCVFFRDLIDVYQSVTPEAGAVKVILTKRETGNKWAASALGSILNWHPSRRYMGIKLGFWTFPLLWPSVHMLENTFFRFFPSVIKDTDVEMLAHMHDSWNDYVRVEMKNYAEEYNLHLDDIFLEFQVKEGWDPLCKFLGAEKCPSKDGEPFPHINDKAHYTSALFWCNIMGYCWTALVLLCVSLSSRLIYRKTIGSASTTEVASKDKKT